MKVLRLTLGFLACLWVLAAVELSAEATVALASRGHVFGGVFGSPGSGPGQFEEPAGVAVDESEGEPASGDIYVVDRGGDRVERFSSGGGFVSEFTGPSASGSGALTEGSATIESVLTEAGAFSVGEEIVGEGLPAGTTIVAIGEGTLEVSAPVEAGKSGLSVPLTAQQVFAGPEDIAVDNSCALRGVAEPTCHEEDPSSGDVYVTDMGHSTVDKFSPTGAYLGQIAGLGVLAGVGVDPHGDLWVGTEEGFARFDDAEVNVELYSAEAHLAGAFNSLGFAVDSEDDTYLHREGGGIFKVGPNGCEVTGCGGLGHPPSKELLNEEFDKEGSDWLASELSSDDVYIDHGGSVVRREAAGPAIETLGSGAGPGQLTAGAGVAVSSASETVYVSEPAAGEVFEYTPEPPNAPVVVGEGVSKVTGDSATLEGEVNPRSELGEQATEYRFEYGPCSTPSTCASSPFEKSVPGGVISPDFQVHTVAPVNVQGLTAATVYHYRVVAANHCKPSEPNILCTTEGERSKGEEVVHTFTTQSAGPLVLPDNRAWELVSPPDKHGALIDALGKETAIQASAAGGSMTFATGSPTESEPEGYSVHVQSLAVRGADGWSSRDMTIPHETASRAPVGDGSEYRLFSEDLSSVVVQPQGDFVACTSAEGAAQPCLSEEATEQTAFLATSFLNHDPAQPCKPQSMHCYEPLVTGAPSVADVPPGTHFGQEGECAGSSPPLVICGPEFLDATPDLTNVVLNATTALSSPAGGNLYEWSAGKPAADRLAPVSVLPEAEGGGPAGGFLGFRSEDVRHAISEDGSRVFWSTSSGSALGPVYVRDVAAGETVRINVGEGSFQDASSDGSKVFYTEGGALYECALSEVAGKLACTTSELGSGVIGAIPGESEDGSWVYFVATSVLAPGAVSGEPNLYVHHGGVTRLVAVLTGADSPDWGGQGAVQGNLSTQTSRVSPDGQWLAFMSQRGLTGYDTRDAVTGASDEEVYLYDGATGKLVCASCDPSGARPVGEEGQKVSIGVGGVVGGEAWQNSTSLAANVPAWEPYRLEKAVYQPRYLADSGRLFFNARNSLVPQAANGNWDVYEYEPLGVGPSEGACASGVGVGNGSEVFEPERVVEVDGRSVTSGAGCVALISGGGSGQESAFLDASQTGSEVFFMTTSKLASADVDDAYDVYDAHECTTASPCFPTGITASPPCDNEASCRPAPTPQPQVFGAPASATFSGPGNFKAAPPKKTAAEIRAENLAKALKVCRKKPRGKRKACEARARKRYGPKAKPKPGKGKSAKSRKGSR